MGEEPDEEQVQRGQQDRVAEVLDADARDAREDGGQREAAEAHSAHEGTQQHAHGALELRIGDGIRVRDALGDLRLADRKIDRQQYQHGGRGNRHQDERELLGLQVWRHE